MPRTSSSRARTGTLARGCDRARGATASTERTGTSARRPESASARRAGHVADAAIMVLARLRRIASMWRRRRLSRESRRASPSSRRCTTIAALRWCKQASGVSHVREFELEAGVDFLPRRRLCWASTWITCNSCHRFSTGALLSRQLASFWRVAFSNAHFAPRLAHGMASQAILRVDGMVCGSCTSAVNVALRSTPGVSTGESNPRSSDGANNNKHSRPSLTSSPLPKHSCGVSGG